MKIKIQDNNEIRLGVRPSDNIKLSAGDVISTGSSDYEQLENLPSIEGVTLIGDISLDEIGAAHKSDIPVDVSELINDAGYITEDDIPPIPTEVSELVNDVGYITENDIPPLITDLGYIDPEPYEEDVAMYMNTLTEDGFYKFTFGGDDFTYIVEVQSLTNEDDGRIYLNQHYWGDEEGPRVDYVRAVKLIDGEVDYDITTTYLTYETASDLFASKNHTHYRTATQAMSVWDYCNSNQISFVTDSPLLFTDSRSPKNHWLIETTSTMSSPVNRFIRLTSLADGSKIYQRSGTYSSGHITWGDWYAFTGTIFTP